METDEPNTNEETTTEVEEQQEPDTFPRAYVESLRAEAAEHRTGRTAAEERSEAALSRLRDVSVAAAVRDVLQDPSDLPWSDDFNGEDGLPDAEKITAAAEELVQAKPHLGKVRGSIGQGYRGGEQPVSLVEALRGA